MQRVIIRLLSICLISLICVAGILSQSEVKHVRYLNVPMGDGVRLASELFLPDQEGPFPTVLIRTPYNKAQKVGLAQFFAERGYAVLIQDVRGRWLSEGKYRAWIDEKRDGLETLNWISNQSWCNDNIAVVGSSYLGFAGIILAPSQHPALKTIINVSGPGDLYYTLFPGGAFHQMALLPWTLFASDGKMRRPFSSWGVPIDQLYAHRPLAEAPGLTGYQGYFWNDVINHQSDNAHWKEAGMSHQHREINLPIFHITGWNDFICSASLKEYTGISQVLKGSKEGAFQKLLVGPWHHDQLGTGQTASGDEEFGPLAKMESAHYYQLMAEWLDIYLKGEKSELKEEAPVKLFVMGKNKWVDASQYPPEDVHLEEWFISSNAGANSINGDGILTQSLPKKAGKDDFVYDPDHPVPTYGGANIHFFIDKLGVRDQSTIEEREDVLVYTSDFFSKEMTIIGPIQMQLYASTDGPDTDFTAKLVEVRPDGYARIIQEGIIRGRFRKSFTSPELLEPEKVYEFKIDMGHTAISIPVGNRLRLEISSSNYPKYNLNPNTGEDVMRAVDFKKARQTIYFSEDYPSRIILPVKK